MSSIMAEVRDEVRLEEKTETVLRMLNIGGFSLETIAAIALMNIEEVRKLAEAHKEWRPSGGHS